MLYPFFWTLKQVEGKSHDYDFFIRFCDDAICFKTKNASSPHDNNSDNLN
jgi:hypothetical protein